MKLYKGAHWVCRGGFHFVFKTKHHEPIFRGGITEKIKDSLFPLKEKHGIVDFIIRIFPYHIHLFTAPLHKTSPLAFGQEVLGILEEVVYNHYGAGDVFEKNFYSATVSEVSSEAVDKILSAL
jgi:REP element-mobilizing transposase RayT